MKGMFRNWTIGKKLTGAFSLMSILVAIVGVIGALDLARVRREADVISSARAGRFAQIQVDMLKQTAAEKDYLLSGDQKMRELHRSLGQRSGHARCRDRQGAAVRRRQTRRGARAGQTKSSYDHVRRGRGAVRGEAHHRGDQPVDERIGSPRRSDGQRSRPADS